MMATNEVIQDDEVEDDWSGWMAGKRNTCDICEDGKHASSRSVWPADDS